MALTDNLVAYYKMDESSGDMNDAHSTNDGTLDGCTQNVANGAINTCYSFNGTTDHVTLPSLQSDTSHGAFQFWFRIGSIRNSSTSGYRMLFFADGTNTNAHDHYINFPDKDGRLRWRVYTSSTSSNFFTTKDSWAADTWFHIVCVWDADTMYIYVDGSEDSHQTFTVTGLAADNDCVLGAYSDDSVSWVGDIDEVAIWDDDITSTDVSNLYNSGSGWAYPFSAAGGTDFQINIGDVWKAVPLMKLNIGDDWKAVAGAQVNIGDAWKTIF